MFIPAGGTHPSASLRSGRLANDTACTLPFATPATAYLAGIKATPSTEHNLKTHDRVRTDRVDKSGTVTLRVAGKLRHIGIGRTHAGTHVKILAQDHEATIINATTGEVLRQLTIDLNRDYQPRGQTPGPAEKKK